MRIPPHKFSSVGGVTTEVGEVGLVGVEASTELFVGGVGSEGVGVPASEGVVEVKIILGSESVVRGEVVTETDGVVTSGGVVGLDSHVCISLCSVNPSTHEQA